MIASTDFAEIAIKTMITGKTMKSVAKLHPIARPRDIKLTF